MEIDTQRAFRCYSDIRISFRWAELQLKIIHLPKKYTPYTHQKYLFYAKKNFLSFYTSKTIGNKISSIFAFFNPT